MIANLPILDYPENDLRFHSLSDPNFQYHERLFEESPDYLTKNGRIQVSHANLSEGGFEKLESLAKAKGFKLKVIQDIEINNYKWRNYEFKLK